MYNPDIKEFIRLSKKGNVVPVFKEILADMETPVSTFLKLARNERYSYLLESVEGGERWGRFSFISWAPKLVFQSRGKKVSVRAPKENPSWRPAEKPLDELKQLMSEFKPVEVKGLPRFWGGAVGYASYDMVRFIEKLENKPADRLGLPDSVFLITDHLVIFDHLKHTLKIVVCADMRNGDDPKTVYKCAVEEIEKIESKLEKSAVPGRRKAKSRRPDEVTSNMTGRDFEKIVVKAKKYIKAGDIIQTVLSQRFSKKLNAEPFDVYRALRLLNPSPYMYFINLDGFSIAGSSPEILVRKEDSTAETRPIAGTKPRGKTEQEETRLVRELLSDKKERAEHIMLVDLGRNDLGRVCRHGSVKVPQLMTIEKYSHVIHIVSSVTGTLKPGVDSYDLFAACFPAGTLSGAPKIRAMEIIDELEPEARGPYGGAVGYFSFSGNMDMAITIRTMIVKDGTAYIQAGAGIVYDSVPSREYQESKNKAAALFAAIDMAEKGIE
ncbi:MAG: anthranilate synthase component I [Elusimicrobiota bacterium]